MVVMIKSGTTLNSSDIASDCNFLDIEFKSWVTVFPVYCTLFVKLKQIRKNLSCVLRNSMVIVATLPQFRFFSGA